MNPTIVLDKIAVEFRARTGLLSTTPVRALDSVSLAVNHGETLAVVGESGCGKTTLGRISLRLLTPKTGRVLFDGTDITAASEGKLKWFRRRAQGIFQDAYSSLDPYMNVRQTLEEPLVIHHEGSKPQKRDRTAWAMDKVKLSPAAEFSEKFPHMLSGGQRQRVGIARALILNPDYIVADEPLSMIDASGRAELLHLFSELQETYKLTVLYITHDIATANHFANNTAVMYLGQIVESGATKGILRNPLHPYTSALIDAVPTPDPANLLRKRKVIPGEPPSPINVPSGCRFHPRCPFSMPGKCDVIDPSLIEVRPKHLVACHLYPAKA